MSNVNTTKLKKISMAKLNQYASDLWLINDNIPLAITALPGSGKTFIADQLAEVMFASLKVNQPNLKQVVKASLDMSSASPLDVGTIPTAAYVAEADQFKYGYVSAPWIQTLQNVNDDESLCCLIHIDEAFLDIPQLQEMLYGMLTHGSIGAFTLTPSALKRVRIYLTGNGEAHGGASFKLHKPFATRCTIYELVTTADDVLQFLFSQNLANPMLYRYLSAEGAVPYDFSGSSRPAGASVQSRKDAFDMSDVPADAMVPRSITMAAGMMKLESVYDIDKDEFTSHGRDMLQGVIPKNRIKDMQDLARAERLSRVSWDVILNDPLRAEVPENPLQWGCQLATMMFRIAGFQQDERIIPAVIIYMTRDECPEAAAVSAAHALESVMDSFSPEELQTIPTALREGLYKLTSGEGLNSAGANRSLVSKRLQDPRKSMQELRAQAMTHWAAVTEPQQARDRRVAQAQAAEVENPVVEMQAAEDEARVAVGMASVDVMEEVVNAELGEMQIDPAELSGIDTLTDTDAGPAEQMYADAPPLDVCCRDQRAWYVYSGDPDEPLSPKFPSYKLLAKWAASEDVPIVKVDHALRVNTAPVEPAPTQAEPTAEPVQQQEPVKPAQAKRTITKAPASNTPGGFSFDL